MVILFPVPGYLAKKVQDVQVQKMKMVLSFLVISFILTHIYFELQDGCSSARCYRRFIACNHGLSPRWLSFYVYSRQCPADDQAFWVGT